MPTTESDPGVYNHASQPNTDTPSPGDTDKLSSSGSSGNLNGTNKATETEPDCVAQAQLAMPWLDFNARLQLKTAATNQNRKERRSGKQGNSFRFPFMNFQSKNSKTDGHQDAKRKSVANGADEATRNHPETDTNNGPNESSDSVPEDWMELKIPKAKTLWAGWDGTCIMLAGVALPAIVIALSLISIPHRMTLVLLNHPLETMLELLLIVGIPFANFFVWSALCKNKYRHAVLRGIALGSSIGSSLLTVIVSIAAVFAGHQLESEIGTGFSAGFICIALLFMFTGATSIYLANRARLTHDFARSRMRILIATIAGGLVAFLAFAAAEAKPWVIRLAEVKTQSNVPTEREQGWNVLRAIYPEKEILMECSDSRAVGLCGLFLPIKSSLQHQLYFSLTGKPYSFKDITNNDLSSMPDDYLSRHVVGEKIPGLSITRSSITGNLHPDTLSSTLDWTFVFKNQGQDKQEARAEIGLPPGAVITGMTLWNKGEPEDAAFAASGKAEGLIASTNSANPNVPASITDLGHGRMLIHCYPVRDAEELKVKVNMVVPLKPEGDTSSSLEMPRLLAENFKLENEHQIRLKSTHALSSTAKELIKGKNTDGTDALYGTLSKDQIENANILISAQRDPFDKAVVAQDKIATAFVREQQYAAAVAETQRHNKRLRHKLEQQVLNLSIDGSKDSQQQLEDLTKVLEKKSIEAKISPQQEAELKAIPQEYVVEKQNRISAPAPKNLLIVVDGSATVKDNRDDLIAALNQIPTTIPTRVVLASNDEQAPVAMPLKEGLEKLKTAHFLGGHDNLKSVVAASELAGEIDHGALLWIHGPQPVLNQEIYIMEPYVGTPLFYELPLGAGDTDTFDFFKNHTEIGPFSQIPRSSRSVKDDLLTFFSKWKSGINGYEISFANSTNTQGTRAASEDEASELLALHANREVRELVCERHIRKAARIAVAYGIVTPVSCAIVPEASDRNTDIDDATAANSKDEDTTTEENSDAALLNAKALPGGMPGAPSPAGATAPSLSGATNGTIGPQGADATYVTGVNTAGTVRVNNLANLEAMLNILANVSEISMLIAGGIVLLNSLVSEFVIWDLLGHEIELGRGQRVTLGAGLITIGLSLPGLINWFVASARDANLFS
jgi:hypothetical protein